MVTFADPNRSIQQTQSQNTSPSKWTCPLTDNISKILIQSNSSLHMSGETDIEEVYLTKLLGIHEDREFIRQARIERSQTVCPASILETSLFFMIS